MKRFSGITAVVALLFITQGVQAESLGALSLRSTGILQGRSVTVHFNGQSASTTAGTIGIQIDPNYAGTSGLGQYYVDLAAESGGRLAVFCADIYQYTFSQYSEYQVLTPTEAPIGGQNNIYLPDGMSASQAQALAKLWANYRGAVVDNNTAAAFQLAQWEIINETEGVLDLTDPNSHFYTSTHGGFIDLANQWLGSLASLSETSSIMILGNDQHQDFGIWGVPSAVPEPITLLCVLFGAGSVGLYVKRRAALAHTAK